MSRAADDLREALPLSAAMFHILLALAGGERHGYGIIKEVEAQTDRTVKLAPATFYRLAKQMQNDGWIADVGSDDDDERRRYYRLTPRGRRIAQAEAQRLEELVRVARARRLLPALARA